MGDEQSQVTVRPAGGYTEVARHLTERRARPVSRQQVYMWWTRRERNGFPAGWPRPTLHGAVQQFYLDEVLGWHHAAYPDPLPAPRDGA